MFRINLFRKYLKGLEDLLPYDIFVDEGIILNKSGSFTATFHYRGEDLDSANDIELNSLQQRLNSILMRFDSGWMFHIDCVRSSTQGYIKEEDCYFPDPTSYTIDHERRLRYNQQQLHYMNAYYITITYMPPNDIETRFGEVLKERKKGKSSADVGYKLHLKRFKLALLNLQDSVKELRLKPLNSSQMLSFIYECMTGKNHGISFPKTTMYLDYILGRVGDLHNTLTPKIGDRYFKILTIVDTPGFSYPSILEVLTKQRLEYRWNQRFICLSAKDSDVLLKKRRKLWWQKRKSALDLAKEAGTGHEVSGWENEDSVAMAHSVNRAVTRNNSGDERHGFYTSTLIVFHEDPIILEDHIRTLKKAVEDKLFIVHAESLHLTEAYLGSLPANDWANVRMPMIGTNALSDFIPCTSVWSGLDYNPNPIFIERGINNPPMLYTVTDGATPFKLSLHVSDSSHTLIIGPPRTGKDVLMNLLAVQSFRYKKARVFMFDRDQGAIQLCYALGGRDYDIGHSTNKISFQPLRNLEKPEDLDCARVFIKVISSIRMSRQALANPDNVLTFKQEEVINNALRILQQKPKNERSLSNLQALVSADKELFATITYYTRHGPFGDLFDSNNEEISITDSLFTRYEMGYMLTQWKDEALVPFLVYIINRIKIYLLPLNYPVFLFMNEIWAVLLNKKFIPFLEDLLRTGGKNNLTLILATQQTTDITNSPLADVLITSCPTKIYLPNPEAKTDNIYKGYHTLGLNNRQIQIISNSTPKKQYYYTSPLGRRKFELDICDFTKCFVGIYDPELARQIYTQDSKYFTYHWVKYFANKHNNKTLHDWADYWSTIYNKHNNKIPEFNNGDF